MGRGPRFEVGDYVFYPFGTGHVTKAESIKGGFWYCVDNLAMPFPERKLTLFTKEERERRAKGRFECST
jgi:hypothetical protein